MTQGTDIDPFAETSAPSLSFDQIPINTKYRLRIDGPARKQQSRDYNTGEPKWWDKEETQPVMCAVVNGEVLSGPRYVGEMRSIWATMPSSMFRAIQAAQKELGQRIDKGLEIEVWQHGVEPSKDKKKFDMKLYTAKLFQGTSADPFSSSQSDDSPPPF